MFPVPIPLSPSDNLVLPNHKDDVLSLGYNIPLFPRRSRGLTRIPFDLLEVEQQQQRSDYNPREPKKLRHNDDNDDVEMMHQRTPAGSINQMAPHLVVQWARCRRVMTSLVGIVMAYAFSSDVKQTMELHLGVLSNPDTNDINFILAKAQLLSVLKQVLPSLSGYGRRGDKDFYYPHDILGEERSPYHAVENDQVKQYLEWKRVVIGAATVFETFFGLEVPSDEELVRHVGQAQLDQRLNAMAQAYIGAYQRHHSFSLNRGAADLEPVDTTAIDHLIQEEEMKPIPIWEISILPNPSAETELTNPFHAAADVPGTEGFVDPPPMPDELDLGMNSSSLDSVMEETGQEEGVQDSEQDQEERNDDGIQNEHSGF